MNRFWEFFKRRRAGKYGAKASPLEKVFLVVDDDPDARQTIIEYLRSFGYNNILESNNGANALLILQNEKIDFVISDWEMPGATGLDLLRVLKTDPKYKHTPFLMVTSPISQERGKVEDAALLHVDGYIIKPFRSELLREKVNHALAASNFKGRNGALVVDDDADVRQTVVEFLKNMGYDPVVEAADGDEGFAALQVHADEIAIVLSDWEMPKLAGIDFLQRIRADSLLSSMPFIMVTSQTSIERLKVSQALTAEVDNYLLKPFRMEDLKKKVEEAAAKAKAQVFLDNELERADEALEAFRTEEALLIYRQVIEKDPKNVRAHVGVAMAYRLAGDESSINRAVNAFRKTISLFPHHEDAYIELALTYEHLRSSDAAIDVLRESLKFCMFSPSIHFHLGRLLLLKGQAEEGRTELKRTLELEPGFQEAETLLKGKEDK